MRCAACATENPPRAKFCLECAAPLARQCTNCGSDLPPAAKFCMECAHPVAAAAAPTPAPGASPHSYTPSHLAEKILVARPALEGEPKQVTILFADVAGSTELIRDRDPEEAQRLLDGAVQVMMDAVHRYEGTVSRLLGDGLMAMFGAPVAHEDHAVRACYAALAMLEAAGRHAEETRRAFGVTLSIRVGLSAGDVAWEGEDCFGTPVVEARRLCDHAGEGQILVSDIVRVRARSRFRGARQGGRQLGGIIVR